MQNLTTLNNQLGRKDLFEDFKLQLAKDFEQSNFPAGFVMSLEPDYNQILAKLSFELERNTKRTDFNLMQLLYRIDVSETKLKKQINEYGRENYFNVIAELIINRVLQKVVVKHLYKNKP